MCDLDIHVAEQLYEVVHVENVGDICEAHIAVRQEGGTDNLQGLVLGALRMDFALQAMSAFDNKC